VVRGAGGFAHDAEIRFALEHRAQAFSHRRMIIDQYYAHGEHRDTRARE